MDILVISLVAFLASCLTFFSGFGLGTLLVPVVALFFPIELAIGMTAIVHLSNNLFKVALIGQFVNKEVLFKFGVSAVLAALIGALLLGWLAQWSGVIEFQVVGLSFQTNLLRIVIGILILFFVFLEFSKKFNALSFDRKYLPIGGMISGFFGGLSGHQGAFRSMFLLKAGLNKEQFIATGVMVAVLVDISRLIIYSKNISDHFHFIDWSLVLSATLSAFAGAYLGKKLLQKTTIKIVQLMVSVLLVLVALGLITGVI